MKTFRDMAEAVAEWRASGGFLLDLGEGVLCVCDEGTMRDLRDEGDAARLLDPSSQHNELGLTVAA